jgi:hypothetical protein
MPQVEIFSESSWIETKANGGHWGDRTLNRTRSRHDRTRPVSGYCYARRGALGFATGASSPSRNQSVRSLSREDVKHARSIERGGASGHDRSDAFGHTWVLTGLKPDAECNASSQL